MSIALMNAMNKAKAAEEQVKCCLKRDYPIGEPLSWKRNGVHRGTVIDHSSFGDRIKVRNAVSGKEYWISALYIVGAMHK